MLQCVAVCCSVVQFGAVCLLVYCSVLQCIAVCCSVSQCVAVYRSVLQCTLQRMLPRSETSCSVSPLRTASSRRRLSLSLVISAFVSTCPSESARIPSSSSSMRVASFCSALHRVSCLSESARMASSSISSPFLSSLCMCMCVCACVRVYACVYARI